MQIREATFEDAAAMSAVLKAIKAETGRPRPTDRQIIEKRYLRHPDKLITLVATDENDRPIGFQSLLRATPGNAYGVQPGWGIIGTHIDPDARRQGIGTALCRATHRHALDHGLRNIDATIDDANVHGLAYYDAIGFRTYSVENGKVRKYPGLSVASR